MDPTDEEVDVRGVAGQDELRKTLVEGQRRGLIGGDVDTAVTHARGFAQGVDDPPPTMLDIGSGAGLPGLVLTLDWPTCSVTLLDGSQRSVDFLKWAVDHLALGERVQVLALRAEVAGRDAGLRGSFAMVTARGFGPPGTTAECAAPLLSPGGVLVVSEPPSGGAPNVPTETTVDRWPADGLRQVGLRAERAWQAPFHYRSFRLVEKCPDRFPRRIGVPRKRPLF